MVGLNSLDWLLTVVLAAAVSGLTTFLLANLGTTLRTLVWCWKKIAHVGKRLQTRCREHRAEGIMQRTLEESRLRIPIDHFNRCLRQSPDTSAPDQLASLPLEKPGWLNDYFVARALAALVEKRRAVTAELHDASGWPTHAVFYLFLPQKADGAAEAQAREIETNDVCAINQQLDRCPLGSRFEIEPYSKTVAYDATRTGSTRKLKELAPPCGRCWERAAAEQHMGMLVANFIQNELRTCLTDLSLIYILHEVAQYRQDGTHGTFMESVVSACIEDGLGEGDLDAVLQKVEAEIGIVYRRGEA